MTRFFPLVGSRRLTKRNRRFVKQILSQPDLPHHDVFDVSTGSLQKNNPCPVVGGV